MNKVQTPEEALKLALTLAITAPSDEKAQECIAMADSIASGLDLAVVEQIKADVVEEME